MTARAGKALAALALAGLLWCAGAVAAKDGPLAAVRRVVDGDTLELADGRLVRLIGVNAPEIDHEARLAEPLALEARDAVRRLLPPAGVRLEFDVERKDRHGRTLAYVFLPDGRMLNEWLLREGLAHCLPTAPNLKYDDRLLRAQRAALQEKKGLWGLLRESPGARFTGSRRSRRVHLASCPEARRIAPPNRVTFFSLREAFQAGYAPARDCMPAPEKKPF